MSLRDRLRRQLFNSQPDLQPVATNVTAARVETIFKAKEQKKELAESSGTTPPEASSYLATYREGEAFSFRYRKLTDVIIGEDAFDTRSRDRHNQHYIHASDLLTICPRAYVMAVKHDASNFKKDFLSLSSNSATQIVRKMGRACETHIRDQFIKTYGKQVHGIWQCLCGNRILGVKDENLKCPGCKDNFEYKENPIFHHRLRIVGNPDLPIIDGGEFVFTEIKSMKKELFQELAEPTPEHLTQVFMYRDFALESGNYPKVSKNVVVIYAAKDFIVGKTPYKEFLIDTEDDKYQYVRATMARLYAKAEIIRDALATSIVPNRRDECSSIETSTARGCPMCVSCFSI